MEEIEEINIEKLKRIITIEPILEEIEIEGETKEEQGKHMIKILKDHLEIESMDEILEKYQKIDAKLFNNLNEIKDLKINNIFRK